MAKEMDKEQFEELVLDNIILENVKQSAEVLTEQIQIENHVAKETFDHNTSSLVLESNLPDELSLVDSGFLCSRFDAICRCCLQETKGLMSIFDQDNCASAMIEVISSVQISANDNLPKNICTICLDLLNKFISFRQLIESSDFTLRQAVTQICNVNIIPEVVDLIEPEQSMITSPSIPLSNVEIPDLEVSTNIDDIIEEDYKEDDYVMIYEVDPILYANAELLVDQAVEIENNSTHLPKVLSLDPITQECLELEQQPDAISDSIKCQKCNEEFKTQSLLTKHLKAHSKKKANYSCPICNKTFSIMASLECHMVWHRDENAKKKEPEGNYKCSKCEMAFTIERDLYIHGSIHTEDENFRCRGCAKEFPNLVKLKRHVKIHFEDKPIKCLLCGRGFPEMASLTRHFRTHTSIPRNRNHSCTSCGKAYYDSHSLLIHMRTHTGEKPWKCTKCEKRFIDSRLLNSHMRTHLDVRNYTCSVCERKFTHRSTLVSHMRIHTGEKPFVCTICNKSFIQSSNLMLHIRIHSGEKPYKCNRCSKAFGSSSTLAIHLRTHTGEKPYSCKLCGKHFARHNLKIHMRTHTGEKPFECVVCLRKFATTGQLAQHKRTHSGDKPYACEICDKKWTSSAYLKKHMLMHSINAEEQEDSNNCEMGSESILLDASAEFRNHRIRIEEIQSDAEFNENALLVNDLLASVNQVNTDVLQGVNVEISELTADSNSDLNEQDGDAMCSSDVYVTEEA